MEKIIEYEKLVNKIAGTYSNYSNYEDLHQVGMIGLLKAVDKYKPSKDTKFSTYAYMWIKGEILEYLRCDYADRRRDRQLCRCDRNIKLSKDNLSILKEINICKEILQNKLNKEPTTKEIAFFLNKDIKEIEDALIANELILSCDYVQDIDNENNMYDYIPYNEKKYDPEILDLYNAIDNLNDEEKKIIKMRYFNDMTQKEVSEYLGTNQVNISRKEEKILTKLNKSLVA